MPNDWIADKGLDWLEGDVEKPKNDKPQLKTLTEIGDERQKDSEIPKLDDTPPAPPPSELIPYSKVYDNLENAALDVLASHSRLGRATDGLGKIAILVSESGPKSKGVLSATNKFKASIDEAIANLKRISEDINTYKNTLPKDTEQE